MQIAMGGSTIKTLRHRQVVKMLATVLGLFIVCRGPWYFSDIIFDSMETAEKEGQESPAVSTVRWVTQMVLTCNSWLTPLVFSLFNRQLRSQMFDIVRGRTCRLHCVQQTTRLSKRRPSASAEPVQQNSVVKRSVTLANKPRFSNVFCSAEQMTSPQSATNRELTLSVDCLPVGGASFSSGCADVWHRIGGRLNNYKRFISKSEVVSLCDVSSGLNLY